MPIVRDSKRTGKPLRNALTLIELVVVLAILAIVLSLLTVAVQSTRSVSRRTECQNRQRQLILAVHQYEIDHRQLPCAHTGYDEGNLPSGRRSSGFWRLFPYLGHEPLAKKVAALNPTRSVEDHPGRPAERTRLPVLLCPSDPVAEGTSHRFCFGTTAFATTSRSRPPELQADGAFGYLVRRTSEIAGGLSSTAAFSERRLGGNGAGFDGRADIWATSLTPPVPTAELKRSVFLTLAADLVASEPEDYFPIAGRQWHPAGKECTAYDHLFAPNAPVSGIIAGLNDVILGHPVGAVGASSYHHGGVNVARMDGSVGFVSDGISYEIWETLGSIDRQL